MIKPPTQESDEKFIRELLSQGNIRDIAALMGCHESLLSKEWNSNEPDHKAKIYQTRFQLWAMSQPDINPNAAIAIGTWIYADVMLWANQTPPATCTRELVCRLSDEHSDVVKAELNNRSVAIRYREAVENYEAAKRVMNAYAAMLGKEAVK